MKYNVNINQKALADEDNFDLVDGALLDFFWWYCNSRSGRITEKRITHEGEKYTWIDYSMIIDQMPLLNIKSRAGIGKRIQKLKKSGYIKTVRPNNQKNYIAPTGKMDKLFTEVNSSQKPLTEVNRAVNSSLQSCKPELTNNNTRENNISENITLSDDNVGSEGIKQPKSKEVKDVDGEDQEHNHIVAVIDAFHDWNPAAKRWYNHKTQRRAAADLVEEYGLHHVLDIIEILPKTNEMPYIPTITTPHQLLNKWESLRSNLKSRKNKKEDNRPLVV